MFKKIWHEIEDAFPFLLGLKVTTINQKEYPFIYRHSKNQDGCDEIAFLFKGPKSIGDTVPAQEAIFLDGSIPKHGDPFKCSSCGEEFEIIFIENVERNIT